MVLEETMSYITILAFTIIFTAFAFTIKEVIWSYILKMIAGLFWMVLSISNFYFFGADGFLMIMSIPYVIIGLLFFILIIHDTLKTKHDKPFIFND